MRICITRLIFVCLCVSLCEWVSSGLLAQAFLSIPNGAISFATLEMAKSTMISVVPQKMQEKLGPAMDLLASACGTVLASVVSVPQTIILDRTMAGYYPNFVKGIGIMAKDEGVRVAL